jgi:predicted transcriptional regulator of viral defense system
MQRLGFIHDMMDVKVLILFVTARSNYPMTTQEIYELCYQDDCLSYFDVCTAIPQMVESGHLEDLKDGRYLITEKGREDGKITEDSIAFTVRQRAEVAVEKFI